MYNSSLTSVSIKTYYKPLPACHTVPSEPIPLLISHKHSQNPSPFYYGQQTCQGLDSILHLWRPGRDKNKNNTIMSLMKLKHKWPIISTKLCQCHFHFTQSFHLTCNTIKFYCELFHGSTWRRLEKHLPS